jgi:phosphate transport system ATP-binding protein
MSIKENVLYGVKANHLRVDHERTVRTSLEKAALWDEVKDRLKASGMSLSLGQQQRLCIARALAVSPEVVLMDEPAASLDPISTYHLENSILAMRGEFTVIIVTHDMQQARRVADNTLFMLAGRVVEHGPTPRLFQSPERQETHDYLSGRLLITGQDHSEGRPAVENN